MVPDIEEQMEIKGERTDAGIIKHDHWRECAVRSVKKWLCAFYPFLGKGKQLHISVLYNVIFWCSKIN